MKSQLRRYVADVGWPTAVYFACVIGAALVTKQMQPGGLRLLVAMVPIPSVLWLALAELRRLRRRDELRQRIELEAMATAFSVTFFLVATLTFLRLMADFEIDIYVISMIMAVCWIGAQLWVRARYRYGWCEGESK